MNTLIIKHKTITTIRLEKENPFKKETKSYVKVKYY